jgi:ubiquinone/menaquinone biosynthesis C-methylase UbiE
MTLNDYTSITELPTTQLTPDQIHRFAHRYGYAHRLAHGKGVLEIACGAGGGLNYLKQVAAYVVGLDYSGGVLSYARQDSHVPLAQGDAQWLPIASEQVDLILCFEAIYYLEDYRLFLAESQRVLRPGGRVLICQSNPDWPDFVPGRLTSYYPSLPELAASLTASGFSSVQCYGTLPVTATSPRQQIVNRVRRWAIKSGILSWLGPLKPMLLQISYGQLHPLPAAVDAEWIESWQGDLTLTPLPPTKTDSMHRVIYVEAAK